MTQGTASPADAVRLAGVGVTRPGARGRGPTTVFVGLDLTIAAGSFVAVVGPSGCGKSTLLRLLAGLLPPDAGSVQVLGEGVARRRGTTSWLPQRDALLPWRRVLGNAVLGAELAGVPRAEAEPQARELLARFGLEGLEREWPSRLSGGMRQRLAVLRTFLAGAPVLLLDEPFGALDALTRRTMQRWLEGVWLAEMPRRTVVLVTHDVDEAVLLADRVLVLDGAPSGITLDLAVDVARPRAADVPADPALLAARSALLAALGV